MEKLLILSLLLLAGITTNLRAQCNVKKELSGPSVFAQDPSAKAALIAASDETIEERIDAKTGQRYYVRRYVSPWSGASGYHLLSFDPELEQFIERQDIAVAFHGGQDGSSTKGGQTPGCKEQGDSTKLQQRKLMPDDPPSTKQPRRSSRVKLAADF